MREKIWAPFLVVAAVSGVCGALLLGTRFVLAERIEQNRHLAQGRLLLEALGLRLPRSEMQRVLKADLRSEADSTGRVRRWVFAPDGNVQALLYPMEGKGLWGPMRGVVAVTADGTRIVGVRIFMQEETPGLGASIEKPAFLARFAGRAFASKGKSEVLLRVVKAGTAKNEWEIDGISGATETTRGFDRMLRDALSHVVRDQKVHP